MMKNCVRCGSLFAYQFGAPICENCQNEEEEEFKKVKEYLYDHPGASMVELVNVLEIKMERIRHYLKEGRLEIQGEGSNLMLECESCGTSISTGKLCQECTNNMTHGLKGAGRSIEDQNRKRREREEVQKKGTGMRFLNKK